MMHPTGAHAVGMRDALLQPVCSSRARGWTGLELDVYPMIDVEMVAAHPQHLVSIQLTGCRSLYQGRAGREVERPMLPGEVVVTPAGEPKTWSRKGPGSLLVMSIAPKLLDGMLAQALDRPGAQVELLDDFGTRDPTLVAISNSLRAELAQGGVGSRIYVEALIAQLAIHLIRRYSSAAPAHRAAPSAISGHKLKLAKAHVTEHIGEDLSVEAIARAVGMSPYHFAHAFRAATGVPPHQYVMQVRVETAKSLLRNTRLSVTEIANCVGYASASHFCVGFQKQAGMSPSAFRKAP
jgi:AraC family transcriptional regulator